MSAQPSSFTRSPLVATYRAGLKACPVCGKRDNCSIREDRSAVFCRRVRSEHPGAGGWLHMLTDDAPMPPPPVVKETKPVAPVADKYIRDAVYRALLWQLTLSDEHRSNLVRRGLNEQTIEQGKFKSTPDAEASTRIAAALASEADLAGVAGFYREGAAWRMVKVPRGFFVPVLDRGGLIQGLQIRRDELHSPKDPRYIWLSSKGYAFGTSSGAPCHVQNPERIAATGRAVITEGSLKAFVAAQYLSPEAGGLLALAGVATFRDDFGSVLKQAFPTLQHIAIAFDRDWKEKREVKAQLYRLLCVLKRAGFESITIQTWDRPEKGLDDLLVAEAMEEQR